MKKSILITLIVLLVTAVVIVLTQQKRKKPAGPKPRTEIPLLADEMSLSQDTTLSDREHIAYTLRYYIESEDSVEMLLQHMDSSAATTEKRLQKIGDAKGVADIIEYYIHKNLTEKRTMGKESLPMSYDGLKRMVIEYECFKMERYVTSGVFPKRYFGYFDEKYDTAPLEERMRILIPKLVSVINLHQKEIGDPLRITDIEVAVTFIAEGGAILLRERQDLLKSLHPVFDVGLDDLASGGSELKTLQRRIDSAAGTNLTDLVQWTRDHNSVVSTVEEKRRWLQHNNGKRGPHAYLARYMTFEEAIAGTALMYLWEKRIAQKKMQKRGQSSLVRYTLKQQFIISSLVYNSGLLHTPERWRMIEDFTTGDWIFNTSERNAKRRWRLNMYAPADALQSLLDGYDYLEQPTEWLAVYHIMQRYGAFVALLEFSDFFTPQGAFSPESEE